MIAALKRWVRRRRNNRRFPGTAAYWEQRYAAGGNSGSGSYGRLADFKAAFLNDFVQHNSVQSVVELGCGDGNQLSLAQYPRYLGLDISRSAIDLCRCRFAADPNKSFMQFDAAAFTDPAGFLRADIGLSLDVFFHLVELEVFEAYLQALFTVSSRFVVIYASDFDSSHHAHENRRSFSRWIAEKRPGWRLLTHIPNPYPYDPADSDRTSMSDFFVYGRANPGGR